MRNSPIPRTTAGRAAAAVAALAIAAVGVVVGAGAVDSDPGDPLAEHLAQPTLDQVDLAAAVAEAEVDGTRFVVAPGLGPLARPGQLCFVAVRGASDSVTGCGDGDRFQSEGAMFTERGPQGERRVWAFVPEGYSTVTAGGEQVGSVTDRFFTGAVPSDSESVTFAGEAGQLDLAIAPGRE